VRAPPLGPAAVRVCFGARPEFHEAITRVLLAAGAEADAPNMCVLSARKRSVSPAGPVKC
jgi:hypothetical protein